MKLTDLFEDDTHDVTENIMNDLMDILTPLVAHDIPYITIQQIIDKIDDLDSGVVVDRNLVMTLLDPNYIKLIKKIEGDKIYLTTPMPAARSVSDKDKDKETKKMKKTAKSQAQKSIKNSGPGKL